jgi:hypothetical protein
MVGAAGVLRLCRLAVEAPLQYRAFRPVLGADGRGEPPANRGSQYPTPRGRGCNPSTVRFPPRLGAGWSSGEPYEIASIKMVQPTEEPKSPAPGLLVFWAISSRIDEQKG